MIQLYEKQILSFFQNKMPKNPNILSLAVVAGLRGFGFFMLTSFLALYVYNILKLGFEQTGFLILIVNIPAIFLTPLAGLLSDRLGRRKLILICLVGEACSFFVLSLFLKSLIIVVLSAMTCLLFDNFTGPPQYAYIADFTKNNERTKSYSLVRVGYNAGIGLGISTGGVLVEIIGFSLVTFISASIVSIASILVLIILKPSPYDQLLSTKDKQQKKYQNVKVKAFKGSISTMVRDKIFIEVCLTFLVASLVIGQWTIVIELMANTKLGISYSIIGLGVALNAIIIVVGQTFVTNAVLNHRHTSIAIWGLLFYVIGDIILGAVPNLFDIPIVIIFFTATLISSFGETLIAVPMITLASNLAPIEEIGNYNGLFQTIFKAGWQLSTVFGTLVLEFVQNPLNESLFLILPSFPSVLLLMHLSFKIPKEKNIA